MFPPGDLTEVGERVSRRCGLAVLFVDFDRLPGYLSFRWTKAASEYLPCNLL
jgi:hypothetical protein